MPLIINATIATQSSAGRRAEILAPADPAEKCRARQRAGVVQHMGKQPHDGGRECQDGDASPMDGRTQGSDSRGHQVTTRRPRTMPI